MPSFSNRSLLLLSLFSLALSSPPADYYASINPSLSGPALAAQLTTLISNHTSLTYAGLWAALATTDAGPGHGGDCPAATVSDIYSAKCWTPVTEKCGNYKKEGDCWNREHSWPKSWWGGSTLPAYTDLYHLYPSDGYDNNKRANFALGNVDTSVAPKWNTTNGSLLGSCVPSTGPAAAAIPGSDVVPATCWAPNPVMKGELARTYLYMSVAYASTFTCCDTDATEADGATMKPWLLATILDWHDEYPVTPTEAARMEVVFGLQGNRNPFIDFPEWADRVFLPPQSHSAGAGAVTPPLAPDVVMRLPAGAVGG